jgi:murein DD-endopeptidase MepM/ murein hydrolase activator NlpD
MTKCLKPVRGSVGGVQGVSAAMLLAVVFGVGFSNWRAFFAGVVEWVRNRRLAHASEEEREMLEELKRLRDAEKTREREEKEAEREARRQEKEEKARLKEEAREARRREKEEKARIREEEQQARREEQLAREREIAAQQERIRKEREAEEARRKAEAEKARAEAEKAQQAARAAFGGGGDMSSVPTTKMDAGRFAGEGLGIVTLIRECGLVASNGEGFRTIEQGGLTLNGEKVTSAKMNVTADMFVDGVITLRKGKKTFRRVELS